MMETKLNKKKKIQVDPEFKDELEMILIDFLDLNNYNRKQSEKIIINLLKEANDKEVNNLMKTFMGVLIWQTKEETSKKEKMEKMNTRKQQKLAKQLQQ